MATLRKAARALGVDPADAGHPAVLTTAVVAVALAGFLLTYRAIGPGRAGDRPSRPVPA